MEELSSLLRNQKVMTVCVVQDLIPWCAPVYYYFNKSFYFFSSPESIHILYGIDKIVSSSIFFDGNETSDIKGVQMRGRIYKPGIKESSSSFINYVQKFNSFLPRKNMDLYDLKKVFKSEFYAFSPEFMVYKDNSTGFGNKNIIDVSSL